MISSICAILIAIWRSSSSAVSDATVVALQDRPAVLLVGRWWPVDARRWTCGPLVWSRVGREMRGHESHGNCLTHICNNNSHIHIHTCPLTLKIACHHEALRQIHRHTRSTSRTTGDGTAMDAGCGESYVSLPLYSSSGARPLLSIAGCSLLRTAYGTYSGLTGLTGAGPAYKNAGIHI